MNKERWKSTAKIVFGLGLLLSLLGMIDVSRLWASLRTASAPLILASFLLFASQGIFESARLRVMFAGYGIGPIDSVRLFLVGMFFGNFMPGMIGADAYQVQQMHAIKPGLLRPLSLSLFLRVSGLFINLLLAVMAIFLGAQAWSSGPGGHFPSLKDRNELVWMSVIFLGLFLALAFSPWGRSQMSRVLLAAGKMLREFVQTIRAMSNLERLLVLALGLLVILSRAASYYVLVLAVGSTVGALDVLLAVTLTAVALALPISFAGLGVREISLSAVLIAAGVEVPAAVAVSIVSRCYIWALSLVGGAWFLLGQLGSEGTNQA